MPHFLRCFILFLVLAIAWVICSGRIDKPFFLFSGLVSVTCVLLLALRLRIIDEEAQPIHVTLRFPLYAAWMSKEMLASSLRVATLCIAQSPAVDAGFRWIKSRGTHVGHAVYANSITLTPGTVTVDVCEHGAAPADLYVHALDSASFTALEQGNLERKMQWLVGKDV